ncbi:glycosyltransferase involved in cell wall biosynthesis [Salirhabdus euzebyi]|uniref:Glycosyltransferase involved in cell wall biosynthesis n=1 Tax=Salirhabdus euzebyi TaxID=394506 RepID=A0A841PUF1_9BACI|nr:glycosyltransferase family 4 protein [Salirhabdus euzebyi]MBB6452430.1 glycosyltransferase involved in cell wall biosynthesis [Salirhabdus euzebyi]
MKVLLITPNFHQPRGNTVTVQRIANGLQKLGVRTEIISNMDDNVITELPQADIVHGFHAYRFYQFKEKLKQPLHHYVVTMTGTDLNHDLFNKDRRKDVLDCLRNAKAIHVFDHEAKGILAKEASELYSKIHIIHQGTPPFMENQPAIQKDKNTFLFVLPAGIRKVKNVPSAIHMLKSLHDNYPYIRLWLVGPVIEQEEGKVVQELVGKNSDWVTYIGQVDHDKMGGIYHEADAVLNTSISEGQSAAILEAMSYGIPVIASDNHGNKNIVTQGKTGFVYENKIQFLDYAEQIMNNIELRQQIGETAKNYIAENHSSSYEANKLQTIYENALQENIE